MSRKYLLFAIVVVFSSIFAHTIAQTSSASALWPLTSTTTTAVTTSGLVTASPETFKNAEVNAYSGTNSSQRVRMAGTGNTWPAGLTYQIDTVYIQFAILPKKGSILHVDIIGMGLAASSSSTFEANVYYSTNYAFTNPDTIRHVSSSANNYLSTSAITNVYKSSLNVDVAEGDTLYVRVYPWHEAASTATGKYLCIQNVIISGETESVPVSSSIIWPCTTDLSSVVSGYMVAGTPTLSNLLQYSTTLAYGGSNGISIWTNAIWQAETAPVESRYMQFSASPKTGGTLVLDSISMKLAGFYTNDFRVSVYYSKDPNFTMTTGTLLLGDIAVADRSFTKSLATLNLTVNSGESVYFRLYPYHLSVSGDKYKLVGLNDISVYGKVTGASADPATITTIAMSDISTTYAATGGNISSDGGAEVTARGVCWNTTGTPTVLDSKTSEGTGTGTFKSVPKGLTPNTVYYLRAYAINSVDTSYGNQVTFTTLAAITEPSITTTAISAVLAKTAKSGGNISAWGGDTIKSRGICYNTTGTPTINDSKTDNGIGIGTFVSTMYQLSPGTTYYVRAYATNSAGTGYGSEVSFTTQVLAPDVVKVVAKDGTGDYTTVQAAFNAVPDLYTGRWIIHIKPGTYKEKLQLGANKVNVILYSMHPDSVKLTYDDYANIAGGTSNSYSVAIDADDFTAMNVTFQNTVKNDGSQPNQQAVALRTNGDRQVYYNCKLLGYQDTYYAGQASSGRVYLKNCLVEGSVDFIFGRSVCVFDSCNIHINRNGGCLTAPSTDAASSFGFVFLNDSISADATGFDGTPITSFNLGRPWQNSPRCAYLYCYEPSTVAPAGWTSMQVNPILFAEYLCKGPGFSPGTRSTAVTSAGRQLTAEEAATYTIPNIFAKTTNAAYGYDWIPEIPDLTGIINSAKKISKIGQNVTVYPNPAKNFIHVYKASSSPELIVITTLSGKKMLEKQLRSNNESIDISNFQTGIYIITIGNSRNKLIVK
jgi:pectinesterase